jgi:hypothetical protein
MKKHVEIFSVILSVVKIDWIIKIVYSDTVQ